MGVPAFHVHITFNGWNYPEYVKAMKLLNNFTAYMDADMCGFSHSNCGAVVVENGKVKSKGQDKVCQLDPLPTFPANDDEGFSAGSVAFYVPNNVWNPLYDTERWWRIHRDGLDFMVHACSGCGDVDHTEHAMFSWNYRFRQTPQALPCCHEGPPGCFCNSDLVFSDASGQALTANIQDWPNVTDANHGAK